MMRSRYSLPARFLPLLLLAPLLGCGFAVTSNLGASQNSPDGCSEPNVANILVGDGFLRILCGCHGAGETNGTPFTTSGTFTCHLGSSTNATVFFWYPGNQLRHQIISTGTPAFVSSPLSDPTSSSNYVRVHAAALSQAGSTYTFQDSFSGLSGSIIVP